MGPEACDVMLEASYGEMPSTKVVGEHEVEICEDYDEEWPEPWASMRQRIENDLSDLGTYYWSGRSQSSLAWEFKEQLEKLGLQHVVITTDYNRGIIYDKDGDIEIRYMPTSAGAFRRIFAFVDCPNCHEKRKSHPDPYAYELVAFIIGADSPCNCSKDAVT